MSLEPEHLDDLRQVGGFYGNCRTSNVGYSKPTVTLATDKEGIAQLQRWSPDCAEDEEALNQWRQRLKEKYPIAGVTAD